MSGSLMNDKSERTEKKDIVTFRRVTILMCLFGGTEENAEILCQDIRCLG
jgi:hypothetical protein